MLLFDMYLCRHSTLLLVHPTYSICLIVNGFMLIFILLIFSMDAAIHFHLILYFYRRIGPTYTKASFQLPWNKLQMPLPHAVISQIWTSMELISVLWVYLKPNTNSMNSINWYYYLYGIEKEFFSVHNDLICYFNYLQIAPNIYHTCDQWDLWQ